MTLPYDEVVLVYNPHSTGGAEDTARELTRELAQLDGPPVRWSPTQYAGHARELAAEAAKEPRTLVVSVSGDGGYNEVVTGAMDAGDGRTSAAIVAVAAAGNANDHRRATRRRSLGEAIVTGEVERFDLLRLQVDDEPVRWAHSYVGLGITPSVALELERGGKGSVREAITTVREFARFHPFVIELDDGGRERFDSLVFANIDSMAKYAELSDDGRPDDGAFEVVAIRHRGRVRTLAAVLRAAFRGLGPQPSARRYGFTTTSPLPLQLDGEVITLEAGQHVVVEIAVGALSTVR